MSALSAIARGRRIAESLMIDTGKALRPLANKWVVVDGIEVPATADLFGPTRCKVQTRDVQAREVEVGGRTATEVRMELHLPADTAPLTVGDVWEFTAVHPMSLHVVGERLRVMSPVAGSLKTARRYLVEVVL